jgi:hypothetical protein
MQASSPTFAATVAGAAMTVTYTVSITLPQPGVYGSDFTLAVESLTVDRQTVTDMPDGTRLITGYPAAEAQVTLSGLVSVTDASKTIAWLLNPNEPTSPMYRYDALGALIVIKAGLELIGSATPETFTIFTGYVDDYTVDPAAGTVTLTALDPRTKLTGNPVCPPVYDDGTFGIPTLYAQFALDAVLRHAAVYSWPAQRPSCVLAAGMRGNAYAEVGTLATQSRGSTPGAPAFIDDGGGGMGLTGTCTYALGADITSGQAIFIECWFNWANGGDPSISVYDTGGSGASVSLSAVHNAVQVTFDPDGTGFNGGSIIISTASVLGTAGYLGVKITWSGTATSVTARRAGVTYTGSGTTISARPAATFDHATVQAVDGSSGGALAATAISSVQVTTEASPAFNDTFVRGAALGVSLNPLTVIPDLSGSDIWAVVQQLAEAEMGVAGFDEPGVFRFTNRDMIRTAAPVRTVTPTYSLKTLTNEVGNSFVRNHIQVPVNQVAVQPFAPVWSAPDVIFIPSGGTYSTIVTTDNPVVGLATTCGVIPSGGLVSTSGYRAAKNPNATVAVSNLRMSVAQTGPTTIRVTVINPNGYGVWLISPTGAGFPAGSDGIPMLQVGGHLVVPFGTAADATGLTAGAVIADWQWPPAVEGGAVTNPRGELLLAQPSNLWIQSLPTAQALAQALGEDLYQPKPLWRQVSIVADPRLQLVDRVTVTDPVTTKINDDARIFGIHTILSETDWSMNLDLRSLSTPGGWLIGVTGRSEIGATTYI